MASVSWRQVLLVHDDDDLGEWVAPYYDAEDMSLSRTTEVRSYAGGRRRAITGPSRPVVATFRLRWVDQDMLGWFEDRLGKVLLVRSPSGRNLWGVVAELPAERVEAAGRWAVTLTVQSVTASAEV